MTTKRKWTRSLFALALLAVCVSAAALFAAKGGNKPPKDDPPPPNISYSIARLGTLGGPSSETSAMNELGDVVGTSQTEDGTWTPFVYFSDTKEMVDLQDLLTQEDRDLWRWEYFNPKDINCCGQICGGALKKNESGTLQGYAIRITLSDEVGGAAVVEIIAPNEAISSWAEGINELGDVVVQWRTLQGFTRTFVYSDGDGGTTDIGNLGGGNTYGYAINNLGEITGASENADGDLRAFLFIPGEGMQDLGIIKKVPRVFGGFGGSQSGGNDLNEGAVVVGKSAAGLQDGSPVYHAFREAGQGMKDLGTLTGDGNSGATSINFRGEIVGWSVGLDSRWRGFLNTDEFGMLDLESLIVDLPTGIGGINHWRIQINDAGEICGAFRFTGGISEAFLLTPN